jgi:hypothetical protein
MNGAPPTRRPARTGELTPPARVVRERDGERGADFAVQRHVRSAFEHVETVGFDSVEDAAIERTGEAHGVARFRCEQRDAGFGFFIQRTHASDLKSHERDERIVDPAGQDGFLAAAEAGEVVGGQIDAAHARVLTDVAQNVGHLHRAPQCDAVALSRGRLRSENRHDQQTDGRRNEIAVVAQRLVTRIPLDRDVHARAA